MNWFHDPLIETFGQTLLHSLWQLSAIAAITAGLSFFLRRKSANARYILCLIALLLMTATPIVTFLYIKPASIPVPFVQVVTTENVAHLASGTIAPAPLSITMGSHTWPREMPDAMRPLLPFAVAAYFLGALFFSLRLAVGYLHIRRLPQKSSPVTGELHDLFLSLCHRLAISRPVQLLESALVEVPTILGEFRPIILIPISAMTGMPIEHLHDLLAHELAHVRRRDYLVNIFQCIIDTLLFYHPAVWWLSARIRQEREHCCDDIAIALSGNRLNYAQALAAMESLRATPPLIPASLILGARTGALLPRIRRVLNIRSPHQRPRHLTLASIVFLLLALTSTLIYLGCNKSPALVSVPEQSQEHVQIAATRPLPTQEPGTQVFDIADLLVMPDNAPPTAFTIGSVPPNQTDFARARDETLQRLISLIKENVDPPSWTANGGKNASIHPIDYELVIRQSPRNLAAIEKLLQHLHANHSRMISIESRILLVDESLFQDFAAQYPHLLDGTLHPDGNVSPDILSDKQLGELIAKTQASPKTVSIASPRITLFDGQRGSIQVTNLQNIVSGIHRKAGDPAPQLDISPLSSGLVMDLQAASSSDQKSVAMKLEFELRKILRIDEKPADDTTPDQHITIQTPVMDIHKITSLLSLPSMSTALLGGEKITNGVDIPPVVAYGLTTSPNSTLAANDPRRLLVLIRPVMIQQKDIEKNLSGPATVPPN